MSKMKEKNIKSKCNVCENDVFVDLYGNGECKNCGWKFSKDEELLEKKAGVSYPMLVTPTTAREQYKKGLPFKATFDEFVNGLYFYSEMLFEYNNELYEVFLRTNKNSKSNEDCDIVFCSENMQQEYKTREEFENNAKINGKLVKDVWNEVTFAGFMFCE